MNFGFHMGNIGFLTIDTDEHILMIKKILLRTKFIVSVLLIFTFLISSVKAYGNDESTFTKTNTEVYQLIDDYRYLIIPLVDAAAGATLCGPWCTLLGASIGIIDKTLTYFKYTDQLHLSHGFIGLTMGNMMHSNNLALKGTAMAVGFLLPKGMLSGQKEVVAPGISTIAGYYKSGLSGSIIGGAGGIADEVLLNKNITDKHYLTLSSVGMTMSSIFSNSLLADFVGAGLGLIAANWENEIVNYFKGPIDANSKLYNTFSRFVPRKQLDKHLDEQDVVLVASQVIVQFFALKLADHNKELDYKFEHLDERSKSGAFGKTVLYFAIFLIPYVGEQIITGTVNSLYNKQLYYTIEDNVYKKLYHGENALRLSRNSSSTVLVDNLPNDIRSAVVGGNSLISGAVSSSIAGAYGFGMIIISSPDLAVYSFWYSLLASHFANQLADKQRKYEEQANIIGSYIMTMNKDNNKNTDLIAARNGSEISEARLRENRIELRKAEELKGWWSMVDSVYQFANRIFSVLLNYYSVANNINKGTMRFDDRHKMRLAGSQMNNFLSWPVINAKNIADLNQHLDRVIILEGMLSMPPSGDDKIKRIDYEGDLLKFDHLEIGKKEKSEEPLFKIDDIKLKMGKIYAITGDSGGGKSSLFSKIRGLLENGIPGKGIVYYPKVNGKSSKVVMLPQRDYFPLDTTLQQMLAYPNKIPTDPELNKQQRETMGELLKEALTCFSVKEKLPNLNLDSKENWDILSGGEKKLMLIISAILQQPDILLLDEVFNGMDQKMINATQGMLKKHLPNTLILIVDHEVATNNYDDFYFENMHLNNETSSFNLRPIRG